jgi:site-specific DNA-methyltransferase (adenine-specific)
MTDVGEGKTTYIKGDIHQVIKKLPEKSVDLIYTNPPFGVTECEWDKPLTWDAEFWADIWRVMKTKGIVVIHASGRFADRLTASQLKFKRYEYVWEKNTVTGHLFANKQPLRQTERVFVFYRVANGTYNKQMVGDKVTMTKYSKPCEYYQYQGKKTPPPGSHHVGENPRDILRFPVNVRGGKTVSDGMIAYIIKTYSNPGENVLDMTCHNQVVGDVVKRLGRDYIGVDVVLAARRGDAATRKRIWSMCATDEYTDEYDAATRKRIWSLCATDGYTDEYKTKTQFLGKDEHGQPPQGEQLEWDWVMKNFKKYPGFIDRLYANIGATDSGTRKFFDVPVGHARECDVHADLHGFPDPCAGIPPLGSLVLSVKYLQGKHHRCVAYAGANALYEFMDHPAASQLAKTELTSLQELGTSIHAGVEGWNVVACKSFYPDAKNDRDRVGLMPFILQNPPEFPVVARIKDSSGNANHCVAIVSKASVAGSDKPHYIYDSNFASPLPLSKESLDVSARDGDTCVAIVDAIMLKPSKKKMGELRADWVEI